MKTALRPASLLLLFVSLVLPSCNSTGPGFAFERTPAKPETTNPVPATLLSTATTVAPTSTTTSWLTYTNNPDGYSIQYPSTWQVSVTGDFYQVTISSLAARVAVARPFLARHGVAPSHRVDSMVEANTSLFVYEVVYRSDRLWQGTYPACDWVLFTQSSPDSTLTESRNLYVVRNDYFYQVSASCPSSSYDAYSAIFDKVIASFHLGP